MHIHSLFNPWWFSVKQYLGQLICTGITTSWIRYKGDFGYLRRTTLHENWASRETLLEGFQSTTAKDRRCIAGSQHEFSPMDKKWAIELLRGGILDTRNVSGLYSLSEYVSVFQTEVPTVWKANWLLRCGLNLKRSKLFLKKKDQGNSSVEIATLLTEQHDWNEFLGAIWPLIQIYKHGIRGNHIGPKKPFSSSSLSRIKLNFPRIEGVLSLPQADGDDMRFCPGQASNLGCYFVSIWSASASYLWIYI